jgi:hypothetical protein
VSVICQVSVAGEQIGHAADLAPAIAFGCPVSENGPAPARPIWPVARCRLMSAVFLKVPFADWLRPWQ